jgi:ATP-dependent DNA helicase RecQ
VPVYFVAGSKTLEEMATYLPATLEELEEISGFGKVKVQNFGNEFMAIIQEYAQEKKLSSMIALKRSAKKSKDPASKRSDTKAESFRLFELGKTIPQIAAERRLVIGTIESHLVPYVQSGDIPLEKIVSEEQIRKIEPVVKNNMGKSVTEIRNQLGETASYSEIRFVLASMEYHAKSTAHIDH